MLVSGVLFPGGTPGRPPGAPIATNHPAQVGVGSIAPASSAQRRGIEICGQIGWFHLENVDLPKESPGGRFCAAKFPRL